MTVRGRTPPFTRPQRPLPATAPYARPRMPIIASSDRLADDVRSTLPCPVAVLASRCTVHATMARRGHQQKAPPRMGQMSRLPCCPLPVTLNTSATVLLAVCLCDCRTGLSMKRNEIACVGLRRFATAPVAAKAADAICTNFPRPLQTAVDRLVSCRIVHMSYFRHFVCVCGGVCKHTRSLDLLSTLCTLSYVRINERSVNDNDVFLLTPPRKPRCIIYATLTTLAKIYAWRSHYVSHYVPCSWSGYFQVRKLMVNGTQSKIVSPCL